MNHLHRYTVFSDFDGTITNFETAEGLWVYFLGEDCFREHMKRFLTEKVTLSYAIKYLFSLVPSSRYQEIFDYAKTVELRPGFPEFADYLYAADIPLVVISGGIGEIVRGTLEPYRNRITGCHYCNLSTKEAFMTISSDYDDGIDLIRKEKIMAQYPCDESIFIGDSFTDINASQTADIIFARDRLHSYLNEQGISHYSFETFYDIIDIMKTIC